MISGTTAAPVSRGGLDGGLEDGAGLHLADFRIGNRQAAAAMAEHRVELVQRIDTLAQLRRVHAKHGRDIADLLVGLRQEFVQRRIEQADGHRQAVHDREQLGEIGALHRQELGKRDPPPRLVGRQDHFAHDIDALALEEHMLGAAQTNALGAERAGRPRIGRGLGIGAHGHAAAGIGPGHDLAEITPRVPAAASGFRPSAPGRTSRRW